MLEFLKANLGRSQTSLTSSLQQCQERQLCVFSQPGHFNHKKKKFKSYFQGIALGWFVGHITKEGPLVYWSHGATGGYIAFVGFVKDFNLGTVIFINRGPRFLKQLNSISMADEIGFTILKHLTPS